MRPQELRILMRHKDIKKTMTFYDDTHPETVEIVLAGREVTFPVTPTPKPEESNQEKDQQPA
jgi:hypothetical protein